MRRCYITNACLSLVNIYKKFPKKLAPPLSLYPSSKISDSGQFIAPTLVLTKTNKFPAQISLWSWRACLGLLFWQVVGLGSIELVESLTVGYDFDWHNFKNTVISYLLFSASLLRVELMSFGQVKSWLIFYVLAHSRAANQEQVSSLTQLLTMTTTHKFPPQPTEPALSDLVPSGPGGQLHPSVRVEAAKAMAAPVDQPRYLRRHRLRRPVSRSRPCNHQGQKLVSCSQR